MLRKDARKLSPRYIRSMRMLTRGRTSYRSTSRGTRRIPITMVAKASAAMLMACCFSTGSALTALHADEPTPVYLFPAGAQRGTHCDLRVGAVHLCDGCGCELTGPGVTASDKLRRIETIWFEGPLLTQPDSQRAEDYPQDYAATVDVAADAPQGTRYFRAWTSQGITPAMKFIVGDLPEIVEQETDGEAIPTAVTLPVTINGRIFPREDLDSWSFPLRQGETIYARVAAAELGAPHSINNRRQESRLEARLEMRDPQGSPVGEALGIADGDPQMVFTARCDGVHELRIHDIKYSGSQHFVYRLTLSSRPRVDGIFPLGGRRGSKISVRLIGSGLSPAPRELLLPSDAPPSFAATFEHQNQPIEPIWLETDDLNEATEQEPNNQPAEAQAFESPIVINGRIESPGDRDHFAWNMKKGDVLQFDLRASRLGSSLDSVLVMLDAGDKEVARADDGLRDQTDSQLRFTAPQDGRYCLRVEERVAARGGPEFAYRLRVTGAEPDFRLELPSDVINVPRSGQAKVRLNVDSAGQIDVPIQLAIDGLPPGVTCETAQIKPKTKQLDLTFKADAGLKPGVHRLTIRGTCTVGDQSWTRTALRPVAFGEPPLEEIRLAVTVPTPFKIVGVFDFVTAPRGGQVIRHYSLDRGGFTGPIEVRLAERQSRHKQGVTGPTIQVPADATEFAYPLQLAAWMELGRTSRTSVMAIGTVEDPDGSRHRVSFTSIDQNEQIVISVAPGVLNLACDHESLLVRDGETFSLAVHLLRDLSFKAAVRLELIVPSHMAGIVAESVIVPADQDEAKLLIRFSPGCGPLNKPVVIRATSIDTPAPTIAETHLDLVRSR